MQYYLKWTGEQFKWKSQTLVSKINKKCWSCEVIIVVSEKDFGQLPNNHFKKSSWAPVKQIPVNKRNLDCCWNYYQTIIKWQTFWYVSGQYVYKQPDTDLHMRTICFKMRALHSLLLTIKRVWNNRIIGQHIRAHSVFTHKINENVFQLKQKKAFA